MHYALALEVPSQTVVDKEREQTGDHVKSYVRYMYRKHRPVWRFRGLGRQGRVAVQ
jgi:hypothetical protein